MPYMTYEQMQEHGCSKCYFLQKATSWCCRSNCVTDQAKIVDADLRRMAADRAALGKKPLNPSAQKAPESRRTASEAEHSRRLELYKQGLPDVAIAKACGVTKKTISNWRGQHKLPVIRHGGTPPMQERDPAEYERRMKVYHTAANDAEAGRLIGLTQSAFRNWRHRYGLPSRASRRSSDG